ncbi:MAG: hypothetical protein ABIP48_33075 [Planctomycetota bacterium]
MTDYYNDPSGRHRVWIAGYRDWKPGGYSEVPPDAVALEPAENGDLSAREAARYVEAFNRAALAGRRKIWAVAVPVAVRYDGEPCPGQPLADAALPEECA